MNTSCEVTFDDVARAHRRIAGHARRTPALTSAAVDALTGAGVHFKCENFQRMGAFKFRGAYNALSQLTAEEKRRGVVAFSSGNHAQAVALAGKQLGVPRVIVMPADALLKSMIYIWERMKIVVEPTGALAACALLEQKLDARGLRVGIILSGGNVDVRSIAALL
jgi:threonine dehydratase